MTRFSAGDAHPADPTLAEEAEALERAVVRLAWLEGKLFAAQLEQFDLTPAQYHVLVFLARRSSACTMGCVAEHLRQSSATATGIVDRLVRRGLVQRRSDAVDRRRVIVLLTDHGLQLLGDAGVARRQRTVTVLAGLRPEDRRALTRLLEAYLDRVTALATDGQA
jgi:DNA-binding MarR family transcriptional regulator